MLSVFGEGLRNFSQGLGSLLSAGFAATKLNFPLDNIISGENKKEERNKLEKQHM